ncbi:MAG TPA: MurR/RpiR family transcriptional regulator [Candidatus Faecalibacterium gallistercoris]|uniref:MurR/RpiR family transcriptional regulator n=1 Tax=Candidatus Faecalibacterium gallistercoris TaxID=2838579 RepID=A0A9D2FGR2_9FIRM|nr:MurR/RpiR family transcriptional regulator [Candidatus Faecalibacterium gallistercoris]
MSLIHKVEEITMEYGGGARHSIGTFILEKKSALTRYSLQEIADATYTSKAAVVRFAKALGFSGWKEFLKAFWEEQSYQEQHYTDIDANYPFDADSSRQDIINQLCSLQVESLLDTADLLDGAPLAECAELLLRSRRIAMFGLNPNLTLAELFQRKMLSIGRQVELPSMGDSGLLAHSLTAEDCAVIISYSGNSIHHGPLSVLPVLEERRVPVIALTSVGDNLLRQRADYTLSISSYERLYSKISTFATENSILYILNVLFSCCFATDYQANISRKVGTARRLESERRTDAQALREE